MDCAAGILVNDGKIVIAPQPDQRLGYLHTSYDSPYGKITSGWKYEKNRIVYTFEIPANMTATVRLEGYDPETLKSGSYERVVSL